MFLKLRKNRSRIVGYGFGWQVGFGRRSALLEPNLALSFCGLATAKRRVREGERRGQLQRKNNGFPQIAALPYVGTSNDSYVHK